MSQNTKRKIVDFLEALANNQVPDKYKNNGICNAIHIEFGDIFSRKIYRHFETWDKFSGNKFYPILSEKKDPMYAYNDCLNEGDMWPDNEYGDSRRDLCRHLAEKIKEELNT